MDVHRLTIARGRLHPIPRLRPLEATPSASTGLLSAGEAAYCIAAWLSRADRDGTLRAFLAPELTAPEREVAQVESWILGIGMDHASSISPA
jgi:hypothetical protein